MWHFRTGLGGAGRHGRARRGGRGTLCPSSRCSRSRLSLLSAADHRVAQGRRALCRGGCWDAGGLWGGAADCGLAAGAAAASGEPREGTGRDRDPDPAAAPLPPRRCRGSPGQGRARPRACLRRPLRGGLCRRCVGTGGAYPGREPPGRRCGAASLAPWFVFKARRGLIWDADRAAVLG